VTHQAPGMAALSEPHGCEKVNSGSRSPMAGLFTGR
jgi:hypothetical protein